MGWYGSTRASRADAALSEGAQRGHDRTRFVASRLLRPRHPRLLAGPQGRPISPDESAFREITADLGLRSLSLTPALAGSPEPLERLYLADGHWTPTAHAMVARALENVTRGFLAPRRVGDHRP